VAGYGAPQISEAEMSTLYKIMPRQQWENAMSQGTYEGSEVDVRDGFIHLSAAHQSRETAQKHFAGQSDLVLVSVHGKGLGESLKWEVSRGGALFPHVYGALPLSVVNSVVDLPLVNGVHQFPEGFPQ
jgi:uncharacterized protein (DUF952 family)